MNFNALFRSFCVVGLVVAACAPKAKTVANISIGNTGCPVENLAVFNYVPESRSWRALCSETLYVCSDIRGASTCTLQDPNTEEAGLKDRAKLLLKLDKPRRDLFISSDIRQGTWDEYSTKVVAVSKMSPTQFKQVEDPNGLFVGFSEQVAAQLTACSPNDLATVEVDKKGGLRPRGAKRMGCFTRVITTSPEFAPMTQHPGETFYVPSGLPAIKPLPPPKAVAPEPVVHEAPAVEEAPAEVSPELDAAVRKWLDERAKDILACTGEEASVVIASLDDAGATKISLRGEMQGKAAERCVGAVLGAKQFDSGPAEVMHLVKKPAAKTK